MQKTTWLLVGSIGLLCGLFVLLARTENSTRSGSATDKGSSDVAPLMLYCAASNRAVIETIRQDYEKEFGREVQVQYGPSQTLLSSAEVSSTGDLFLPADDSFITIARDKGLCDEILPIADMHAVIAVKKGNPKNIHSFDDLLKPEVKLVQANADAAAIGKLTRQVLTEQGLWDKLSERTIAFRTTVNDAANDVSVGAADAAIVYDAVLATYPGLEAIQITNFQKAISRVAITVLRSCKNSQQALHFARYISARDRGLKCYTENGFRVVQGDVWKDRPELTIFAGSMLRPAIDRTLTDFEEREGVTVIRDYNGCGILVAQMKAGQHPDAYFACDKEFMNSVPDLFPESVDVSQNELVILVQKGNPHKIRTLKDLGEMKLRVGVGHEKQCAMGWLTQNTLRDGGVQKEVMANVTVQSPTGDMLVNQMRTGALDAAVVYLSNASGAAKELDAIQIKGIPCSIAVQPFAVAEKSPNAQLASRLFQRLQSAESKRSFLQEGFRWQLDAPPETQTAPKRSLPTESRSAASADK